MAFSSAAQFNMDAPPAMKPGSLNTPAAAPTTPAVAPPGATGSNALYVTPYQGSVTDPNFAPAVPIYNQTYNPNTMSLGNDMANSLAGTSYNQQPLQQLQANAESTTPSSWAQLQSQLAKQQTSQSASQAAGQTAGQTAQAQGNLAMSGGLSSGANERTQETGEQAGIGAQQGIQNQGNQQQLQIGLQDAQNKQSELQALPGQEAQAYTTSLEPIQMQGQANAQDVANQANSINGLNQFNMNAYGIQGQLYGANQTALAQENTANNTGGTFGGGGFLGLGSWLCSERGKIHPLSKKENFLLSQLLKFSRKVDRPFTRWYLKRGEELVERIKFQETDWASTTNVDFIDTVLDMLAHGDLPSTLVFYRKHVYALCAKYWPHCSDAVIVENPKRKEWVAA